MNPLLFPWFPMPNRKDSAAVRLGRKRWAKMTPEERAAFVRSGGIARQQKKKLKESGPPTEITP